MASQPHSVAQPPGIADIEAAARRIEGAVVRTPTHLSRTLSKASGATIYVKFENLQFTAAYKERGALNKLLLMGEKVRSRGVIAASAGNHAQAVAYHGARLGVPVTIVMPAPTPSIKVMQTESHGASIVLYGETYDEAYGKARALEKDQGLSFLHPFDDPDVIAGQGTVALEMLADAPEIDCLVVPVGGGGLISGVGTAVRALRPACEVVGVQAELYPAMHNLVTKGARSSGGETIAEGIAVKQPGALTAEIIGNVVDRMVLVSERAIETAVALFLQIEKTVVEGAGAAGLAALLDHRESFAGRNVGLILTGGNIDTRLLATVLLRDLARSGRMARLRIQLHDRPGALLSVIKLFDRHQVNVVEVYHQRIFTPLPAKDAFIDIECEARDEEHLAALFDELEGAGFNVHPVEIQ